MWLAHCAITRHLRLTCVGMWFVFMAATGAMAQTSKLDAPVRTKSTVRSEIKRGEDAASQCSHKAGANYLFFVDCLNGEEHSYQSSDPFLFGLFVAALATGEVLNKDSSWLPLWSKEVARIAKAYKLSESDFCAAFAMKCEVVTRIVSGAK
jgi:hypothetical protein